MLLAPLLALLACCAQEAEAPGSGLSLPPVFADGMVLQAEQPLRFWGRAQAGQAVHLTLGPSHDLTTSVAVVHTRADARGHWQAELPAMEASFQPWRIDVECSGRQIALEDVLVGELWFAAGQSNMAWPLASTDAWPAWAARLQEDGNMRHAASTIRLFDPRPAVTGASGSWSAAQVTRLAPEQYWSGGWSDGLDEGLPSASAVAWWFAWELRHQLDRPIGIIEVAVGGTPTEAWIDPEVLAATPATAALVEGSWLENQLLGEWCRTRAAQNLRTALDEGWTIPGDATGPHHPFQPGFLWRAGVVPFVKLPVRGVLWYQGESNAGSAARVAQHEALFRMLVSSWRRAWGQAELPILAVQLPTMNRPHWPAFREQQRQLQASLPHTGLAITLDVGEPRDVHPRQKRPVGERLARWARWLAYGEQVLHRGPRLLEVQRHAEGLSLRFDHVGPAWQVDPEGLASSFEWQDEAGAWHPVAACEAPSADGRGHGALRLRLDEPLKARAVRYAWAPVAASRLADSDGLPASPWVALVSD